MKKSISVILALLLALGCVLSLGGCGKSSAPETGKKGFIENKGYAVALENALMKPIFSLDAEKLTNAMNSDKGGASFDLKLTELKGIDTLIPAASSLGLDKLLPFGISASAVDEAGSLNALIELTAGKEALSLFSEISDKDITLALPNILDGIIKATAEDLGDITPLESLDILSFDTDPLIDSLFNTFVEALDDTCFTDAVGNLPTADGDKEYKAISLKLTAKDCVKAFAAVLNFIADSTEFDSFLQLVGNVYLADDAASIKSELKNTANELLKATDLPDESEFSVNWTRFLDEEKNCADKISVVVKDELEMTVFAGITSSKSGDYAFVKVTDDTEAADLLSLESEITKDSAELTVEVNVEDTPVKVTFKGETSGKTTVSKVSFGSGGMNLNLFTLTSTVNTASDSLVDVTSKLEFALPASLVGTDIGLTLEMNFAVGAINFEKPDVNSDKVFSEDELEAMGDQLLANIKTAAPTLSGILELLTGALESAGDMFEDFGSSSAAEGESIPTGDYGDIDLGDIDLGDIDLGDIDLDDYTDFGDYAESASDGNFFDMF